MAIGDIVRPGGPEASEQPPTPPAAASQRALVIALRAMVIERLEQRVGIRTPMERFRSGRSPMWTGSRDDTFPPSASRLHAVLSGTRGLHRHLHDRASGPRHAGDPAAERRWPRHGRDPAQAARPPFISGA